MELNVMEGEDKVDSNAENMNDVEDDEHGCVAVDCSGWQVRNVDMVLLVDLVVLPERHALH